MVGGDVLSFLELRESISGVSSALKTVVEGSQSVLQYDLHHFGELLSGFGQKQVIHSFGSCR